MRGALNSVMLAIALTACGPVKTSTECESIISNFDLKVSKINSLSTRSEVIQILGQPFAVHSGTPDAYHFTAEGCKEYKIQFSGDRVLAIQ